MGIFSKLSYKLFETGYMPDKITKAWMYFLYFRALRKASLNNIEAKASVARQIHNDMITGAKFQNRGYTERQSVELSPDFYEYFMGKRHSFSCANFPTGAEDLDEAEDTALWLASDRARIRENLDILEIGCGMGAMTFWLAEKFPSCRFTSLTDSQKNVSVLMKIAEDKKLDNITFISKEIDELGSEAKFDRIICMERFDILSGLGVWEKKIKSLLKPNGYFFLQTPVHSHSAYYSESVELSDLPGNKVIEDIIMPSAQSFMHTNKALHMEDTWVISGEHYKKTADKWLRKFTFNKQPIYKTLEKTYGPKEASSWYVRWRLYLISLVTRYSYNHGQEWIVGQYLYSANS